MRLIDADKLNKKKKYSFQTQGLPFPKNEWFIKASDLYAAPTIDAVPIVRCKNCKYWRKDRCIAYMSDNDSWEDWCVDEDDFCSYGEVEE